MSDMVLAQWERHVRKTDTHTWCSQRWYSYDWVFTNWEHADGAIEQSSRVQPCPSCEEACDSEQKDPL